MKFGLLFAALNLEMLAMLLGLRALVLWVWALRRPRACVIEDLL